MSEDFSTTLRLPRDMAKDIETYWHRDGYQTATPRSASCWPTPLNAKLAKPAKEQRRG